MSTIRFVDLFSGIGGFHLAAERASSGGLRFKTVGACENDPDCRAVYEEAFSLRNDRFASDVQNIDQSRPPMIAPKAFDLLLAGFPCQAFSNVGRRQAFNDERGALFFEIVRILKLVSPAYFILENVQKISTIRKGEVLELMRAELEKSGYSVVIWDLRADHYGVPQQRRRLFFCGVKGRQKKKVSNMPPPPVVDLGQTAFPTTWHLLEKQMPEKDVVPVNYRRTIFTRNPKWMGNLEVDRLIARPICATMWKWHRANQDNYFTERYVMGERPESQPEKFDWRMDKVRRVTLLEALRIQGFPDSFAELLERRVKSASARYRLVGNAVPVPMAADVIRYFIREAI